MSTRIDCCGTCFLLALGCLPFQALAANDLPIRVTTGADGVIYMTNLPKAIVTQHAGAEEIEPSARHASLEKTSKMRIPVAHEPTFNNETSNGHQNGKSFMGDD